MVDFGDLGEVVLGDQEVARDVPEEVMAALAVVLGVLEVGPENLEVVDYFGKEVVVDRKPDS